jgi:hypothetical protein
MDKSQATDNTAKRDVPDWVLQNLKKAPQSIKIPVNQQSTAIFLDKDGNERPANYWRNVAASGRAFSIPCDPFDDNFVDNVFTFDYILVNFYGYNTTGFNVESEFILSTAFNILPNAQNDQTKPTSGRVRVRDRVTSNILYNYTNLPITITNMGPDPSNSNKTLYKLKFTTPLINDPNISLLDVYFDVRPIVYTDCSEVIITTSNWQSQPFGVVAADVCSRVDNVGIQPAGSGTVYVSGCDVVGNYPTGVRVPHEQEVQYNPGSGWTTIQFPLNSCTKTRNLIPFDVWPIFVGSGTIKFRWRNIKHTTDNCAPNFAVSCTGPFHEITINVP